MKKIVLFLLLYSGFVQAQIVNIPDPIFKAKLLAASPTAEIAYIQSSGNAVKVRIDTNYDGEIQVSEAAVIDQLNISYSNISSVEGVKSFINLTHLLCDHNALTSLDVSGMLNLLTVFCDFNNLATLDLTAVGPNFKNIECGNNSLTSLALPNTMAYVDCRGNQLTSLNLAGLTDLDLLICHSNQLTELDLTGINQLYYLMCSNNLLTSLDFTGLVELEQLYCDNNQLTSLDFSTNPLLYRLDCKNNDLSYLNIKNGREQDFESTSPFLSGNPALHYVCADDIELSGLTQAIQDSGLTNVTANTYCSFAPGGQYNSITGNITFDGNGNGCNALDPKHPMIKITIDDGTTTGAAFSNSESSYLFYAGAGNYTLAPVIENPAYFTVSPAQAVVNFQGIGNLTAQKNFCLSAVSVHPDVEITLLPLIPARPGFDADYRIVYRNKGNTVLSGNISLIYDEPQIDYISSQITPDIQGTGSLSWNYNNLLPFEQRGFNIKFNVNSPMETPPVNIGDQLNFVATVNPLAGDETPEDNVFGFKQTVVGSFDPNDKHCLQGSIVSPTQIGNYLFYVINFENTGNFPAENVAIKDLIDTTKFDLASFQMLGHSHNVSPVITNGKVEFFFEDINLDPNEYGYVGFKIKTRNDLPVGSTVTNTANIYFDFNFPVITNPATTTFQSLGVGGNTFDATVKVFPNPARDRVQIKSDALIAKISVMDVQGRIIGQFENGTNEMALDVSAYASGMYAMKITTEKGTVSHKLMVE